MWTPYPDSENLQSESASLHSKNQQILTQTVYTPLLC